MSEMTRIWCDLEGRGGGSIRAVLLVSLVIGSLIGAGIVISLRSQEGVGEGSRAPQPTELEAPATRPNGPSRVPPAPVAATFDSAEEIYFRMIRVSYATGGRAPARHPRSREDAVALATEVMRMLGDGEATFEALAREHSDHPSSVKGGVLPRMRLGQLPAEMRETLAALPEGQPTLLPIESETALFVLQREPLPPTLAVEQILIRTSETSMGGPADERSREQARVLAESVIVRALEPDADFAALIGEFSEDPGKFRGGRLGPFPAEMMPAELSAAVMAVEEWEVCPEPVPNDLGFLVLRRIPLEATEPPVPSDDPVAAPTTPVDPARVPAGGSTSPVGDRAVGFEVLVTYRGAVAANLRIKRTLEEAEARARAIVTLARSQGQDFQALVEGYSEARGRENSGGSLGVLMRDRRVHQGHDVVFALEPGQVSDVFESDRGFHVFLRQSLEEIGLRDILITYQGARNASPKLDRTSTQAQAIADAAHDRLVAGESFAEVARSVSDQRRASGGALGVLHRQHPFFREFPGHLQRGFGLEVGGHSEVFESTWGFHIIYRDRVLRARHLRIAFAGKRAVPRQAVDRARAEAEGMIQEVLVELAAGRAFRELVIERSEDPDARRGGDTGVFGPGQREEVFCSAVAALEPGQTSDVIETAFGLEIVERLPLEPAR